MYAPAAKKLLKNIFSQGIDPQNSTFTDNSGPVSVFFVSGELTGKERDPETGLYYYGARYLDPRTSRWLSVDPAMGEYIPLAPINDDAKKHNQNLPGIGGIFNYVNMHVYHYGGNNPVRLVDPDGRSNSKYKRDPEIRRQLAENARQALMNTITSPGVESAIDIASHPAVGALVAIAVNVLENNNMLVAAGRLRVAGTTGNLIALGIDAIALSSVITNPDSTVGDYANAIFDIAITAVGFISVQGAVSSLIVSGIKEDIMYELENPRFREYNFQGSAIIVPPSFRNNE